MPGVAPTPSQEELREALARMRLYLGFKQVLELAEKADAKLPITRNALSHFALGKTKKLTSEHRETLAKVLYKTPLGRAFRGIEERTSTACDQLIGELVGSESQHLIEGLYFVYHGALSIADRVTIRLMNIKGEDESFSSIYEFFHENATVAKSIHQAIGIVLSVDTHHQLLTLNKHSAVGLQIITVEDYSDNYDKLNGNVFGMRKTGEHFYRKVLMVRMNRTGVMENRIQELAAQTGVFQFGKLSSYHRHNFEELAENAITQRVDDPVLRLGDFVS